MIIEFHIRRTNMVGLIELGVLEYNIESQQPLNGPTQPLNSSIAPHNGELQTQTKLQQLSLQEPRTLLVDTAKPYDISFVNLSLLTPGCKVAQVS